MAYEMTHLEPVIMSRLCPKPLRFAMEKPAD